MANPAVVVDFVANTQGLSRGMQQASGAAGGLRSKLAGLAKAGALAGLGALVATVKTGAQEFAEAQKVTAQTESVLKSTGKAAGVTAGQVESLAGALMKKSGVDDEAIQSGENLLLTFTNVRNEAGKGNDVFNQATATMTDMSVALGQDMKTSAIQLGKALNDPVKGITALQRVGVSFTDAQKKQIEQMQKSGDTMGAQKVILGELKREFGGSAEAAGKTLPGQLAILRQEFSNLAGELVGRMVPVLLAIAKFLNENRTAVIAVVGVLVTLTATVMAVNAAMAAWTAIQAVAKAATVAWTAAQWLLNAALAANPIGLVIVAVAALVAAFVIAYKTSDTFRNAVNAAFDAILKAATAVFNWLKANWPLLLAILTGPIGAAVVLIAKHWDTIADTARSAVNAVRNAVVSAWSAVRNATADAWGAVAGAVSDAASAVRSALNSLASWVSGFASGVLATAVSRVRAVWDNIADGAKDAVSAVKGAFNDLVGWLGGVVDRMHNAASNVANALKAPINAVLRAWNSISLTIPRINIPSVKIGKKKIGGGSFGGQTFSFPNVPLLAKGAVVEQPTLAMIGEAGREIVAPEKLLRDIVGERNIEVRVFIGQSELTQIVRTEIIDANTGLARSLLAAGAGA